MKADRAHGVKTNILSKLSLVVQSIIELTSGAAVLTFIPLPEEQIEDKFAKSTTAIVLSKFAGMTYQVVLKGGSKLYHCILRQKANCVKVELDDSFVASSEILSDDDEDAAKEGTASKCYHALHVMSKFVCEVAPASGVVAAGMLIPMSESPEDKFAQSAALMALGMFGYFAGGAAHKLASGATCCPSRQKRITQISLQPSDEVLDTTAQVAIISEAGTESTSRSSISHSTTCSPSYSESYGTSPMLVTPLPSPR